MAIKINNSIIQSTLTDAEKEELRLQELNHIHMVEIDKIIKKACKYQFPDNKKQYFVMRDRDICECSLESYLKENSNLLFCRLYQGYNKITGSNNFFNRNDIELIRIKELWDSFTEKEQNIIIECSRKYRQRQTA